MSPSKPSARRFAPFRRTAPSSDPRRRPTPWRRRSRVWWNTLGLSLLLFSSPGCRIGDGEPGPRGRRVVLITLDTLRYDTLMGTAEAPEATAMPGLRERSREAARFVHAFAATSTTAPTHASLLTALSPWRHGVLRNGMAVDEALHTLAERMKAVGFETGAVVSSYPVSKRFGFAQGFDTFVQSFDRGHRRLRGDDREEPARAYYSHGRDVTDQALAALDGMEGDRQFLWLHYFDLHSPYGDCDESAAGGPPLESQEVLERARAESPTAPAEAEILLRARRLYDLDAACLDRQLERLFTRLDADRQGFETHVLLTADHGESFGEDASVGHGRRLTAPQIRVPLLIFSPRIEAGERRDLAGSVDIAHTALALADAFTGGEALGDEGVEGRDLSRASGRGRASGMRRAYRKPFEDHRLDGVHVLEGHLFYAADEAGTLYRGNGRGVLPTEDGQAPPTAVAQALQRLFATFEEALDGRQIPDLDPEAREALEALGYAG